MADAEDTRQEPLLQPDATPDDDPAPQLSPSSCGKPGFDLPILIHDHSKDDGVVWTAKQQSAAFWSTSLNMQKVILGAGMMVIPKAFQMVGNLLGVVFLSIVGLITWFTISQLLFAAEQNGCTTYASVVSRCCGPHARWALLLAVAANCFGVCVMLIVIFSDILIGSVGYPGLLLDLPFVSADAWYMGRWVVLLVLVVCVLGPLVLEADLSRLGWMNIVGVAAIGAFALSTAVLAGAALVQGTAFRPPLLPDWGALGENWVEIVISVLSVMPILLSSDICHQGVFPATSLLRPYSRQTMDKVNALALGSCNLLYVLIAVCAYVAFGPMLDDDVLNNMNVDGMTPLVGPAAAAVIGYGVRAGYFVSLLGSFVLCLYPLRSAVLELLTGAKFHPATQEAMPAFIPVTVTMLALIYGTAVFVPSIWVVTLLVGSVASTLMGFIMPGCVILSTHHASSALKERCFRAVAVLVILLGTFLLVNGLAAFSKVVGWL